MRLFLFLLSSLTLAACSHTVSIRTSPFMTPTTEEATWRGQISGALSQPVRVTLINDTSSTPPTLGNIKIDEETNSLEDSLGINLFGIDGSLGLWQGLSAYKSGMNWGLKYQLFNNGPQTNVWVAAIQASLFANQSKEDSQTYNGTTVLTTSEISNQQFGLSVGSKFPSVTAYTSVVSDELKSKVNITNGTMGYGPYEDKGKHMNYSVGVAFPENNLALGFEYTYTDISWDRGGAGYHTSTAGKLGLTW